jgi:hypothetical protein
MAVGLAVAISCCGGGQSVADAQTCLERTGARVERSDPGEGETPGSLKTYLEIRLHDGTTGVVDYFGSDELAEYAEEQARKDPKSFAPRREGKIMVVFLSRPTNRARDLVEGCAF